MSRWQGTVAVLLIVGLLHTGRAAEPAAGALSSRQLESLWADLAGDDARQAYGAIHKLAASPQQTVPFLRNRWRQAPAPVPKRDLQRVAPLLADLDDDEFGVREKAYAELAKLGEPAEPALRQALESTPPLEVRRRVERLLERLERERAVADLRWLRAIQVLEGIATVEARQLLMLLAQKAGRHRLRRDAAASLRRLNQRPPATPCSPRDDLSSR
jgi:hypothetical protein